MALVKKTYRDGETIIYAADMNAMQDEIIANAASITNKQAKITASGILKGNGSGGVSSASAGTDYLAPSALQPYRTASAQDVIDNAQDEQISVLEQTTTATTIGPVPIATFDASAADLPLKELLVSIEPVQAAGTPTPETPLPISGWTGAKVMRTGKNLGNFVDDKTINASGAVVDNANRIATVDPIKIESTKTYKVVCTDTTVKLIYSVWNGNALVRRVANASLTDSMNTSGGTHFYVCCYKTDPVTVDSIQPMVVFADETDLTYEPYGNTYDIAFPGTVYKGSVNHAERKLFSATKMFTFDGSESLIDAHATIPNWFAIRLPLAEADNVYLNNAYAYFARSNQYTQVAYSNANYNSVPTIDQFAVGVTSSNIRFIFRPTSISTLADFKAALAAHPVQVLCNLISPEEYSITSDDITTLRGKNSISADCGSVTVTYGAYLQALKASLDRTNSEIDTLRACIAPIENGATASQSYAQGAFFFRNGGFCKALTAIASGAAFTLGTNYQVTTVAAALIALQT